MACLVRSQHAQWCLKLRGRIQHFSLSCFVCVCGNRLLCNGPLTARKTRSELLHRSCCFHLSRQFRFIFVRFVVLSHSLLSCLSVLLYLSYSFRVFSSYFCLFVSSCLFFPSSLKSHILPISSSLLLLFSSQPCLVHLLSFFVGFSILLFSWVPSVLNFLALFSSLVSLLSSLPVVFPKEQVWTETPHLRQHIANFTSNRREQWWQSRPFFFQRVLSSTLSLSNSPVVLYTLPRSFTLSAFSFLARARVGWRFSWVVAMQHVEANFRRLQNIVFLFWSWFAS